MEERRANVGFLVSLVGGGIVFINALIIVIGVWVEVIESLPIVGELIGELLTAWAGVGLLFAILVILGSFLIYLPENETKGGILAIIFSILSIIIGGGFIIGGILGIIGGILGILKR